MTDVLIRDVPPEVLAAVDVLARLLGISRNEYLRRQLLSVAGCVPVEPTVADLAWFAETFADLEDPAVMREAWD